jgi:hypothetical protein
MPRTPVMAVAALLRPARPRGGDRVRPTHEDRGTCIMSGMDGSHGGLILMPELEAEIGASRVSATLEGASA